MAKAKKTRKTRISIGKNQDVIVYGSSRLTEAYKAITNDGAIELYNAVKLEQVLRGVYEQGKKDGAREVFEAIEATKKQIPHRPPGRPKKE